MTQLAMTDSGPGGREWDWGWDWSFGRHAFREDAALTPIFHALACGDAPIFHALARGEGRREPEPATAPAPPVRATAVEPAAVEPAAVEPAAVVPPARVDLVDAFHRDPLTAPIPIQALVTVPSQLVRRPEPDPVPVVVVAQGRHRLRPAPVGATV